jgi:hypothetical protein
MFTLPWLAFHHILRLWLQDGSFIKANFTEKSGDEPTVKASEGSHSFVPTVFFFISHWQALSSITNPNFKGV